MSRILGGIKNIFQKPAGGAEALTGDSVTAEASMPAIQPVSRQTVVDAYATLMKYRDGKKNLDTRLVNNEEWYRLRHWENMRKTSAEQPVSAWLFNSLANKHADSMDNFPRPNILPRERGDKEEASRLTSIAPVILDQCGFEEVYSDEQWEKLKSGTGVFGVFWDSKKHNGLGDICIKQVDIINLFWESGITDIQASKNLFHTELCDNDVLVSQYPQLNGKLSGTAQELTKYIYDDTVDTSNKSTVIDWYYKKLVGTRTVLHYCKFVGEEVLFATENNPAFAERGFYDHGEYPFVFDILQPLKGMPVGFGFIDVAKNPQEYIDRLDSIILTNARHNAPKRYFIRRDGGVNEEEFANPENLLIHVEGSLGTDSIMEIPTSPINGVYLDVREMKVNELKEVTGNRDVSTGGTTSGATAASAIAAMQEAGSKLSRDNNKGTYRAYRKVIYLVIELIRQFYDLPRSFRILGEDGMMDFQSYSNAGLRPQPQGMEYGMDMGLRKPEFDIEVTAEKASPYSRIAQNEMALQFYGAGFFNPQMADQALACLEMMDFDRKEFMMQKVSQNATMMQDLMIMAQMLSTVGLGDMAAQIAMKYGVAPPQNASIPAGETDGGEASTTRKARERVAQSTSPV